MNFGTNAALPFADPIEEAFRSIISEQDSPGFKESCGLEVHTQ